MKRYWSLLITSDLSPSILPVDSIQPYHDWWIVICVTGNLIRLEDISHVVDAELIQKTLKVYFFQEKWQPCFFRMAFQSISHIRVAYGNWENVVCLCVCLVCWPHPIPGSRGHTIYYWMDSHILLDSHSVNFQHRAPQLREKTKPAGQNRPNLQHPNDQTWRDCWDFWLAPGQ